MTRLYLCKDCGKEKSKKGLYCKICRYKHARRPSGLIYNIKTENKGWFKKGNIPWDKGQKLYYDVWSKGTKGLRKANKASFKSQDVAREKNAKWKGESVGYYALHTWMKRNFNWPDECEFCGSKDNLDLANIEYNYNRDVENWKILCHKCHFIYDYKNNWGYATQKFKLSGNIYE